MSSPMPRPMFSQFARDTRAWGAQLWERLWFFPGHLIWIALAYLPRLGDFSVPLTGDQKVYLSIAYEMRKTGQWIRPMLFGEPAYFKPPLQYWATLLGWKLFGFGLWGALLPSVLTVIGTGAFLGAIATRMLGRRSFVHAGLWFAACIATLTFGTTAQMEIYLVFFYAGAWWAALRYLADAVEARQRRWLYLAWALAGALSLVKSPLYSVFWATGFLTYLLLAGEWEMFWHRHLYAATALGVAIASSWYGIMLARDGKPFWDTYFVYESFEKANGNQSTIAGFWVALLYLSFPLVLLMIPSARALWRGGRRASSLGLFVAAWCWPAAVFFTFYPYRTHAYLFHFIPAIAVLVDWGYYRSGRSLLFRSLLSLTGVITLIASAFLGLLIVRADLAPHWIASAFAICGVAAFACCLTDRFKGIAFCGLATILLVRLTAVSLGETDIADLRRFAHEHPSAPLAVWDDTRNIWHEVGLLSTALAEPIERLRTFEQVLAHAQAGGAVIFNDGQLATVERLREKLGPRLGVTVWSRWKARRNFPYGELLWHGRRAIPDFDQRTRRMFAIAWRDPGADPSAPTSP